MGKFHYDYVAGAKRAREETAKVHAEADARCGRDWFTGGCACDSCRQVRKARQDDAGTESGARLLARAAGRK